MLTDLGKALKRARDEKGDSLEAIAGPSNISAAYLHKLERGVVDNPSPRVLARVALALEVPYLRLMELAGYLDEPQLAEVEARLKKEPRRPHPLAGQRLSPDEWAEVGAFIKKLVARKKSAAKPKR